MAAPAIRFGLSASISAASLTQRPRAPLMRKADGFIARESSGVHDVLGFLRQRAGECDEIRLRKQRPQIRHAVHGVGVALAGRGIALHADDTKVEGLCEMREPSADSAESDDQQRSCRRARPPALKDR